MFDPKLDKYPYPEDTGSHYLKVNLDRGIVFDKNYPYVDNSNGFKFKRFWVRLLLRIIVFPLSIFRFGIKIKGKQNIKAYKKVLANGAITVSNHVHMWDYIFNMKALHNVKWSYVLSWDKNVNGESGPLVRLVGGIPIPENDHEASLAFNNAVKKLLSEGNILQIYAEGSMWEYYAPIRPFKNGAASLAIKNNVPILPMAFSYRKSSKLRQKLFKQMALFTLNVGKPIYPNPDLDQTEQVNDLTRKVHRAVCELAGYGENNIYPAIYNNSKRIDY